MVFSEFDKNWITNLIVHLILGHNGDKDCFELLAAPTVDDDVDAAVDDHEEPAHNVHVQLPLGVVVDPSLWLEAGAHHVVPFVMNLMMTVQFDWDLVFTLPWYFI